MTSSTVASVVDSAFEATVVPSFTRVGSSVRRRLEHWQPLDRYDLTGRVVLVTGGTSGLGREAAMACARVGATVIITGRRRATVEQAAVSIRSDLAASVPPPNVIPVAADMGDMEQVRQLAATVSETVPTLDVLIHNAGALSQQRGTNPDGIEKTVASQVVGPFLLTSLLLERLSAAETSRVITVSSGGMYTAPLTVSELRMSQAEYSGTEQYARAKRAQVTLNELWASKLPGSAPVFLACHPGWADTEGVRTALPRFRALTKPLLRSPADGSDTAVWLACDEEPLAASGSFWHDRRRRSIHRLRRTRRSDTAERRQRLWEWCVATSGVDPLGSP